MLWVDIRVKWQHWFWLWELLVDDRGEGGWTNERNAKERRTLFWLSMVVLCFWCVNVNICICSPIRRAWFFLFGVGFVGVLSTWMDGLEIWNKELDTAGVHYYSFVPRSPCSISIFDGFSPRWLASRGNFRLLWPDDRIFWWIGIEIL